MKNTVSLGTRVYPEIKNNFYLICDEIGITPSSLINAFMKTVIRERRVPFELNAELSLEEYVEQNKEAIQKGEEDIKQGRFHRMKNNTVEELENIISEVVNAKS